MRSLGFIGKSRSAGRLPTFGAECRTRKEIEEPRGNRKRDEMVGP